MFRVLSRFQKGIAFFLLFVFALSNNAWALTSGPSQPETQQFAPAGMDNMVDPFTGDFSYNIPLLDVGGYPVNLSYAAGVTPDQEASWVGLGWNLNVGAINRNIRGIADDFAGENIVTEHHIKPNQTFGITYTPMSGMLSKEIFTFPIGLNKSYNISYNTYTGFAFSKSISASFDGLISSRSLGSSFKLGVSLSTGSESGVGITPSVGLGISKSVNATEGTLNASIGFPFSSREGAKGMSMSTSFSASTKDSYGSGSVGGLSKSSFHGFSTPTYTTQVEHDVYSVNATLNVTPEDVKFLKDEPYVVIGGYYNGQFSRSDTETNPAYGYMYEGATDDKQALLDFNREKDGGYNENTTNMPVTNHTYDIYSVQGEGISGTYRLFRGDVGTVGDNIHSEEAISPDLAVSGGFGQEAYPIPLSITSMKLGVDFMYSNSYTEAGRWTSNRVQNFANPLAVDNSINQNVYFGKVGDMSPENSSAYYSETLLEDNLYEYRISSGVVTGEHSPSGGIPNFNKSGNNYLRTKRRNRTNSFSYLTADKAKDFAISPIYSYQLNTFSVSQSPTNVRRSETISYPKTELPRKNNRKKGHHVSEVRVTADNGSRYVYGIPVYNNVQHDVTFSVDGGEFGSSTRNTNIKSGLVSYGESDVTVNNSQGLENYYNRTILPPSASSYLLNYILSSDYVDSDGVPGPSDGDLGTYVKFNYSKTSDGYKWRTPFQEGKANFSDGLSGKSEDDKGSYSYGEKEVWYLHSIETRTHVAEFSLSDREDGLGVSGQRGGLDGSTLAEIPNANKLKRLDKITLYAKPDKINGRNEALKTVYFKYNYSLCPQTPNSLAPGGGKLTLEKIWFTYGNSNKGILNPYQFEYADTNFDGTMDVNFPYNSKNYDRWGNYKNQDQNYNGINNEAFPYTIQNKVLTDQFAAAYSMTRIYTPTGGEMRIHYESDDYGYVQNEQAMRMYTIKGVSQHIDDVPSENLYDDIGNVDEKLYLHIDLGEGFQATDDAAAKTYFKDNYINGISNLQYRINIRILGNSSDSYEYLTGYCLFDREDENIKLTSSGGRYNTAVVKLLPESLNRGTKDIQPFVKNGWLYANMHYNREMNGSVTTTSTSVVELVGVLTSYINGILEFAFGFRHFMAGGSNSKTIRASKSFVRMNAHDKIKLGGGHRVKAIVMFDRWNDMLSDREKNNSSLSPKDQSGYGQIYKYTIQEGTRTISSGVAAYEPIIGGEENPLRKLVRTTDHVPLAPDKEYYSETPFGESFFPSPTVGYSTVRTIPVKVSGENYTIGQSASTDLASNGTGYVQQEFYTAKDFPTLTSHTSLDPYRDKTSDLNPFKFLSYDYVFGTQGYLIELNDMHGKARSTKVMPDGDNNPISYVRYEYKVNSSNPSRLDNNVPLVNKNLDIVSGTNEAGLSVDVVNDTRYSNTINVGGGGDLNVKVSIGITPYVPAPIIVPVVTLFPNINNDATYFYSLTTTKVVNRYGILQKTIAQENGQTITTENLAWDEQTGEVLLTKVQNEFHDPLYSFTYPAYWAYKSMGFAYQNEGLQFTSVNAVKPHLLDGDEVICRTNSGDKYAYYDAIQEKLIEADGDEVTGMSWAQVIRSGARNVAMTPVASVSTRSNPIVGNKLEFENAQVLNAGATEFKHLWKAFCNCGELAVVDPIANPFTTGQRGQLRPWRSWTYLTERSQTITNGEANIRTDGYFKEYKDFWKTGTSYLTPYYVMSGMDNYKWQFVTQIENYNPLGMEIENKDALQRYSMAQYGYGRNLPIATSNNSKYQETGFDGFEDYDYGDCNDDHFSWRVRRYDANSGLVGTEAHTGKKSFKVQAKSRSKIVKVIKECDQE